MSEPVSPEQKDFSGNAPLELIVLGSGTSMGVPTLGCPCRVCHSDDPHDKRTRPSILLSRGGHNAVIDTSPDFRFQLLREKITRLDAIFLTHGHADHILGFDDIRPFNLRQKAPLPVYASAETFVTLRRTFAYVFDGAPTLSTIPEVTLHEISGPFTAIGLNVIPIPLDHGGIPVFGYRVGGAAYLTDFSRLPESSAQLLTGLDDLIIDALRDIPHPMHLTVDQALAIIARAETQARVVHTHRSRFAARRNQRAIAQTRPRECAARV